MGSHLSDAGGSRDRAACAHKFCPDSGLMSGGVETAATGHILLLLLRPLAVLMLVGNLAFLVRELATDDAFLLPISYSTTAIMLLATVWLFRRSEKSLTQLRVIEIAIIYATFVEIVAMGYRKLMVASGVGPSAMVAELNALLLSFIILMAAYAIFIPSGWQRTALIIAPMAVGTPLVWTLLATLQPAAVAVAGPVPYVPSCERHGLAWKHRYRGVHSGFRPDRPLPHHSDRGPRRQSLRSPRADRRGRYGRGLVG